MSLAVSIADLLGGVVLLCAFLQISRRRLTAMITLSQLSALALTCIALWRGVIWHEWALCGVSLLVMGAQVIILPGLLRRLIGQFNLPLAVGGTLPVIWAILIGLVPIGLAIMSLLPLPEADTLAPAWPLGGEAVAFAVLLLGVWLIIIQTRLLAGVIGFITFENGLILALLNAPGLAVVTLIATAALIGLVVGLLLIGERWYRSLPRQPEADGIEL